jgi:hypothetical protein
VSAKDVLKVERNTVFNEWFLTTTIIINPSSEPPLAPQNRPERWLSRGGGAKADCTSSKEMGHERGLAKRHYSPV